MARRAYLGVGGNIGDRKANLRSAARRIRKRMNVVAVSSLYETEPVGFKNQPAFLNAALAVEAPDDPHALLDRVLDIEADLGRQRTFPNAPRTIDIDVLLVEETEVANDTLTVPHPRMHERAFVLIPLAEIAPDAVHPVFGQTVRRLAEDLDSSARAGVRRVGGSSWADHDVEGDQG